MARGVAARMAVLTFASFPARISSFQPLACRRFWSPRPAVLLSSLSSLSSYPSFRSFSFVCPHAPVQARTCPLQFAFRCPSKATTQQGSNGLKRVCLSKLPLTRDCSCDKHPEGAKILQLRFRSILTNNSEG
eukprot:758307-Hanusia_phi.AAC.1